MSKTLMTLGTFPLGPRNVEVFVDRAHGNGSFAGPESGMEIGLAHQDFATVMGVLVHEAMEFAMMDIRCRWTPAPDISHGHDGYLFVMTHPQFGEASARVGEFLAAMVPTLYAAWKQEQKVLRKGKK